MNLSEHILILDEFATRRDDSKFRAATYYAEARARGRDVDLNVVLLEATRGKESGVLSQMLAHMLGDQRFARCSFVWVAKGKQPSDVKMLLGDARVTSVGFRTREYAEALWTAGGLVIDRAWQPFFAKRPEQVGVIAWSAPVTAHAPGDPRASATREALKNTARSLLQTELLVTPDRPTAHALLDATGVSAIFGGTVLHDAPPADICRTLLRDETSVAGWRTETTDKTRVLLMGCDFGDSLATSEAIELSHAIDHTRYDVTVLVAGKAVAGRERRVRQLHPSVRILHTFGYRPLTRSEYVQVAAHRMLEPQERSDPASLAALAPMYEAERHRLLGDVRFDVAIGFTDRLTEATLLLASMSAGRRVLCLTDPADRVGRRLSARLVSERFDRVLVTPQAQGSPTVRGIAKADVSRALIVPVGRFLGYETSIRSMRDELAAQLGAALGDRELTPEVTDALAAVERAIRLRAEAVQRELGVDALQHNRDVMAVYEAALSGS